MSTDNPPNAYSTGFPIAFIILKAIANATEDTAIASAVVANSNIVENSIGAINISAQEAATMANVIDTNTNPPIAISLRLTPFIPSISGLTEYDITTNAAAIPIAVSS